MALKGSHQETTILEGARFWRTVVFSKRMCCCSWKSHRTNPLNLVVLLNKNLDFFGRVLQDHFVKGRLNMEQRQKTCFSVLPICVAAKTLACSIISPFLFGRSFSRLSTNGTLLVSLADLPENVPLQSQSFLAAFLLPRMDLLLPFQLFLRL